MRRLILVLVLVLGSCVRYAAMPPRNHALDYTAQFVPILEPTAVCTAWTGAGTSTPGVDSVLCRSATAILYCSAPRDAKPKCETSIDWTPKPAPPSPPPKPPEPATPAPEQTPKPPTKEHAAITPKK